MRHDGVPEKRIPYISLCTILTAIFCQTLVFVGNMHTVRNLQRLGASAAGWATTGSDLSFAFDDFSKKLFKMTRTMAYVIDDSLFIQEVLDTLILNVSHKVETDNATGNGSLVRFSFADDGNGTFIDQSVRGASHDTDSFIQITLAIQGEQRLSAEQVPDLPGPCGDAIQLVDGRIDHLKQKIRELVLKLEPVLKQLHQWVIDLSERAQSYVGQIGVTLGKVQEIFDIVSDSVNQAFTSDAEMIDHTYNLFDTTNTGLVSMEDLTSVADMFGLTFLTGDRAVELFDMYDQDEDRMLNKGEFGQMMLDPATPGMMSTVLQAYAERLAAVAGPLKRSETRSEVAKNVAHYLQIVVAKNMTKVSWVAQALTNGSLPLNFTAAVLNHLAMAAEDPNKITSIETGSVLVRRMVDFNSSVVYACLETMVDPVAWADEGLDVELQPAVVERVTRWAAAAGINAGVQVCRVLAGPAALREKAGVSFREQVGQLHSQMRVLPNLYRWRAVQGARAHRAHVRARNAIAMNALMESATARSMMTDLLGSSLPASSSKNPDAARAVQKGRPASPAALEFAQWLAQNASRTAATLTTVAFDYKARSSHVVQGPLAKIRGVSDKVYMALNLANKYTGKGAVEDIIQVGERFIQNGANELLDACNRAVLKDRFRLPPNSTWTKLLTVLKQVENSLPQIIEGLEGAEAATSSFASSLSSIFDMLTTRLPPAFTVGAVLWRDVWLGYYLVYLFFDLLMLFFIMFVSGAIMRNDDKDYQRPTTMREKLAVCWGSCVHCFQSKVVDGNLCFWSVALLIELLAFVSFFVCIVLCVLAGLKIFIYAGCSQMYMLGDSQVCGEVMNNVKFWLTSFLNRSFITAMTVCDERMLLTCDLISNDMLKSSIYTVVGGFVASFLTFQVVIEAAIMHERARYFVAFREHNKHREVLSVPDGAPTGEDEGAAGSVGGGGGASASTGSAPA